MKDDRPQLNIDRLPLILAGPMVRRTDSQSVTVWVALKNSARISVRVYETTDGGKTIGSCVMDGARSTLTVGANLHIVAITATGDRGQSLAPGAVYAYDLTFSCGHTQFDLDTALSSPEYPHVNISYFAHHLPTFVLPPADLERVKIVHGSCRKPHGDGEDALALLDRMLAIQASQPERRPQLLFLTGDQIYGDDVADPLLWVASELGEICLGWEEELPLGNWNRPEYKTTRELPSGRRGEIATQVAGFTAGLDQKRSKVTSHLFGLGEYCAAYLLAWSPVVWPKSLPSAAQIDCEPGYRSRRWDAEVRDMESFIHTLWAVRRVLANIVTYTIFDDHDVSDDWNLNQAWCLRVLGKPLGRRSVSNALLAYSLFQAWGNTPEQFEPGTNGYRLFGLLEELIYTRGYDEFIEQEIGRYVGLPPRNPQTNLPEFSLDGEDLVLTRDPQALNWHYTIDGGAYCAIVCDTRTQRAYPPNAKAMAPPRLLSKSAFATQIVPYLQTDRELLLVLPTNLFGLAAIDWVHRQQVRRNKFFATDVGDAWNIRLDASAELIATICEQRDRTIVLTGDIHYAGAMAFTYRSIAGKTSQIIQFTASACKNEETLTRVLQSKLKPWLLPEIDRYCLGFREPAQMDWQSLWSRLTKTDRADWQGKLHAIEYQVRYPNFKGKISLKNRLLYWLRNYFYNGGEIVGFNNIAIVSWQFKDRDLFLIQDVYWRDRSPYIHDLEHPIAVARYYQRLTSKKHQDNGK
jgi:hypothetical protein